jgi:hypothetical protein
MTKMERIEKLLDELRYEIETGMMHGDVDEHLSYTFIVPTSKNIKHGVVSCRFMTHPTDRYSAQIEKPRLQLVK